jgi:hypothetical protein
MEQILSAVKPASKGLNPRLWRRHPPLWHLQKAYTSLAADELPAFDVNGYWQSLMGDWKSERPAFDRNANHDLGIAVI